MSAGFVTIAGAGPGDPELLTLKAARRLAEADLVLYDALVAPESLALAARARRFYVGKRAGRHSITQETIQRLMIRAARRGERVVRLKGGDPFVFGRGGEEAAALAEAGVPFEVIPGVTSAVAAPSAAGIPVTHRGVAAGFLAVSGHDPATWRRVLSGVAPGSVTVVVLMGVAERARIAAFLLERGWARATPVALVLGATTPRQHTWTGALSELNAAPLPAGAEDLPGTLVVGEVVGLATMISYGRAEAPAAASCEELPGDNYYQLAPSPQRARGGGVR